MITIIYIQYTFICKKCR